MLEVSLRILFLAIQGFKSLPLHSYAYPVTSNLESILGVFAPGWPELCVQMS
jgi:hypothetical protein